MAQNVILSSFEVLGFIVDRVEGLTGECFAHAAPTAELAERTMFNLSRTAPENGTYHKVDITIYVCENGGKTTEYKFRISMTRDYFSIKCHLNNILTYTKMHSAENTEDIRFLTELLANF